MEQSADSPPAENKPAATGRRVVARTFAQREDADRAAVILMDSGIAAEVRLHFYSNPVSKVRETRGCSLLVDPGASREAARLLLRMPPSEAAVTTGRVMPREHSAKGTRLLRRINKPGPQRSAVGIIILALVCAGGAIVFGFSALSSLRAKRNKIQPGEPYSLTATEDLNRDSVADLERTFSSNGELEEIRQDRDCDGTWDARWNWQQGKLSTRDLDIDDDGKWDERTKYDPHGAPFVSDERPGAAGSIRVRRIYRDGILWRTLTNADGDLNFDHITDQDETGDVLRNEDLPPGAPENAYPSYPLEPLPPRPET